MNAQPLTDFSRLAVHSMTNKPWSLEQCVEHYAAAGIPGISVWRNVIEPIGLDEAVRVIRGSGLSVPALVRGGFFPATDAVSRQRAVDENRRILDEAKTIGARMVVLVVGAVPGMPLSEARQQTAEGIAGCLEHAQATGVQLAIEPLHPMYAADRSCINRMAEARKICEQLTHPMLGIAVDAYHVWWDPDLAEEIRLAGEQKTLFAFHICDWRVETRDLLTDRGLMGDGCIDLRGMRAMVEATGFDGFYEVEVFSDEYWAMDQRAYLDKIKAAYLEHA
jgi:sugar phosphate isomerase/epimerase